jgi:septal ring-binding cell division protein DamX
VSTMETPPPGAHVPTPPERRCPRCGSALAHDQEWCLACGAAAATEVAEPRGWRVPVYLTGGLGLLALIGVILVIVALSSGPAKLTPGPTPTPPAVASVTPPPGAGTPTPVPSATASPFATTSPDPGATATASPDPGTTATPEPTTSPEPTATATTEAGTGTFSGWTGGTGWTIILKSASTQADAESTATELQGKGDDVGILHSNDFSSLNPGYYVVFSGTFDSKKAAQDGLDALASKPSDAYVKQISQ